MDQVMREYPITPVLAEANTRVAAKMAVNGPAILPMNGMW